VETTTTRRALDESLFTWPSDEPRLIGARCADCGAKTFPAQGACPRCTSSAMEQVLLPRTGTLWTWTVQGFRPKSPPYRGDDTAATFEPYGVGYVDLDGELMVEARLTENDPDRLAIGAAMELALVPLYRDDDGAEVLTFAFRPVEGAK
jgi:uncharacterized OB-fold protein